MTDPRDGEATEAQAEVCCGEEAASCRCILPLGHTDDAHVCDCDGSWKYVDGQFDVVRLPSLERPALPNEALDATSAVPSLPLFGPPIWALLGFGSATDDGPFQIEKPA